MYEYETEKKVFSKRTYNELPVGFELKQNLHIKIREASQLNELIILLSNSEIYEFGANGLLRQQSRGGKKRTDDQK